MTDLPPQTVDEIWQEAIAGTALAAARPDFRFCADSYLRQNRGLRGSSAEARAHFDQIGRAEGRAPNSYHRLRALVPDLDLRLAGLATDPRIRTLIGQGASGAHELLFELILLGAPHDGAVSDFSASYYIACHPGLSESGAQPFLHYIQHGARENRRTLRALRLGRSDGARDPSPARPTCLIALPGFEPGEGAQRVLAQARDAAQTHNVIIAALRDGPLRAAFAAHAVELLITDSPDRDFGFFDSAALPDLGVGLLNSVQCLPFARPLLRRGIPFATCVTETPEQTRPGGRADLTALVSDLTVFPSEKLRRAWAPVLTDAGVDVARDTLVHAARTYHFGATPEAAQTEGRARLSRLIGVDVAARRVVLGAGRAHWSTGADLFALTADEAHRRGDDTLFVWVGDGRNPEDQGFGLWLEQHLSADGSGGKTLFFLPSGPYVDALRHAADALYLSARMETLPDAVFEAAAVGVPSLLFDGATGFDDACFEGAEGLHRSAFGDISAACDWLLELPRKIPAEPEAAPRAPLPFRPVIRALEARLRAQRRFVLGGGTRDLPVLFASGAAEAEARQRTREKLWTYGRRHLWQSVESARAELAASDNWVHRAARIEDFAWNAAKGAGAQDLNVHMHAHFTEDLGGDLLYYRALREARRLIITTDTEAKRAEITLIAQEAGVAAEVLVLPNTGRDILPFLRLFDPESDVQTGNDDEPWCHIHQKRAERTSANGAVWKRFLLAILLGDDSRLSPAIAQIGEAGTGLVAPFDPYQVGWSGARRLLPDIAGHLPGALPDHPVLFPVGNMFHTRAGVARAMLALFGPDHPWPNEPLPQDGTVYHLIERLWPAITAATGQTAVFFDKPDQPRV